jgi:hypothetical protein
MAFEKENDSNKHLQDVEYNYFISLFAFVQMIPNTGPILNLNTRTDTGKPTSIHCRCHSHHL